MKLAIFGPTGGTGHSLVKQALAQGHEVSAVAREPAKVPLRDDRLTVYRGDVLDPDTLAEPVAGADAVISALGIGYHRNATTVYSAGTKNIMGAMSAAGARPRISCISASSIELPPKSFVRQWLLFKFVLQPLLRKPYEDISLMEGIVRASGFDWTIVRPARLTNGPQRGRYRIKENGRLEGAWSISRDDLADYMLSHISDPASMRSIVEVAY